MYRSVEAEDPRESQLSDAQFEAARLGFFQFLRRKRMSPQFVDRHGEDLFGQACVEYTRQCSEGKEIFDPPAWIITCGWNRTKSLLETRDYRPDMVSADLLGDLPSEDDTPEQEVLSEDRHRKVNEAVQRLPDYQRRLLALSYFEDESVREAARRLGWTPSKAQRAHETARRRLRKMLDVEWSDELAIEVGLAAFLSVGGGGCARRLQLIGAIEGALDALAHPAELGYRLLDVARAPFSHGASSGHSGTAAEVGARAAANLHRQSRSLTDRASRRLPDLGGRLFTSGAAETGAAAAEGGGRTLEVCKAIAAACVIGGGAVTGALIVSEGHQEVSRPTASHHRQAAQNRAHPRGPTTPNAVLAEGRISEPTGSPAEEATTSPARGAHPVERHHSSEQQEHSEPAVKKAKPPPESPEGEFEPSPEAAAEPAPTTVVETETAVTDSAKTTSTASSSSGSGAKPKPVPANSPEEFEP
jgi:RNA polymerase sigma factor (sigma-70 family)